jgi:SAM-dependent methyltransferase
MRQRCVDAVRAPAVGDDVGVFGQLAQPPFHVLGGRDRAPLSLPAARLGAKVLATDWAPKMIQHFNARVVAEGLDAEGRVMDCHALDIADDTYDVTGSQFGVMLVPDQAQALREMVRVTKPGGRVLLIAYGIRTSSRHCTSSSARYKRSSPNSRAPRRTSRCSSSRSPTRTSCVSD